MNKDNGIGNFLSFLDKLSAADTKYTFFNTLESKYSKSPETLVTTVIPQAIWGINLCIATSNIDMYFVFTSIVDILLLEGKYDLKKDPRSIKYYLTLYEETTTINVPEFMDMFTLWSEDYMRTVNNKSAIKEIYESLDSKNTANKNIINTLTTFIQRHQNSKSAEVLKSVTLAKKQLSDLRNDKMNEIPYYFQVLKSEFRHHMYNIAINMARLRILSILVTPFLKDTKDIKNISLQSQLTNQAHYVNQFENKYRDIISDIDEFVSNRDKYCVSHSQNSNKYLDERKRALQSKNHDEISTLMKIYDLYSKDLKMCINWLDYERDEYTREKETLEDFSKIHPNLVSIIKTDINLKDHTRSGFTNIEGHFFLDVLNKINKSIEEMEQEMEQEEEQTPLLLHKRTSKSRARSSAEKKARSMPPLISTIHIPPGFIRTDDEEEDEWSD